MADTLQPTEVITDPIGGYLTVAQNSRGEVLVDFGRTMQHVLLSPAQARSLAALLTKRADELDAAPAAMKSPETEINELWLTLLGADVEPYEFAEGVGRVYCFITEHGEARLTLYRRDTCWTAVIGTIDDGHEWPDDIIERAQVLNLLSALDWPIAGGGVER